MVERLESDKNEVSAGLRSSRKGRALRGIGVLAAFCAIGPGIMADGCSSSTSGTSGGSGGSQQSIETYSSTGKTIPVPRGDYATDLQAYLAHGDCTVVVAVDSRLGATGAADQAVPAESYIQGSDGPTKACLHPEVLLGQIDFSKAETGDVVNPGGGVLIKYAFGSILPVDPSSKSA